MRISMSVCVYYSFDRLFPNIEGVTHRNENCNVCMCILLPWSNISPTWRGLLTEMRIAMSVCVYNSFDHLFPQHGGGYWEKWELQCLCVCIIPLITYFHNMYGVAHRNENCNLCRCILFHWSRISPNMEGFFREMRIALSVSVYFSHDHLFPKGEGGGVITQMRIAMSVCVYYSLNHLFSQHGWVAHRNENCNVSMCILLFSSSISQKMEGVAHINENCNVCMCILFPWSPIFRHGGVCWEKLEFQCMYVYIIPLITYFPKHGRGCSDKWELQCLYVYIIPLVTYFPKHGGGCSQKWEWQYMYMYIIPLITYFPDMEWVAERN